MVCKAPKPGRKCRAIVTLKNGTVSRVTQGEPGHTAGKAARDLAKTQALTALSRECKELRAMSRGFSFGKSRVLFNVRLRAGFRMPAMNDVAAYALCSGPLRPGRSLLSASGTH